MIRDDDIRFIPFPPRPPVKTGPEETAGGSPAGCRFTAKAVPDAAFQFEREIRVESGFGSLRPTCDLRRVGFKSGDRQKFVPVLPHCKGKPSPAEIVGAPDGDHVGKIDLHDVFEKRQILADKLLLKIDRLSRNQYRTADGKRMVDRRNQVGKTFSDSRGRLDAEVAVFLESVRDGKRHLFLLNPFFIRTPPVGMGILERCILGKKRAGVFQTACPDFLEEVFIMFRNFYHPSDPFSC